MWVEDCGRIDKLIQDCGSAYRAVNVISQKARKLKASCNHVISDSQALEWAISDNPPENLEHLMKMRAMREDDEVVESDKLDSVLSMIDEDKIRIAVLNSYKASVKRKQIVFDYNGIKDKGVRTRIRILVRMAYIPELIDK